MTEQAEPIGEKTMSEGHRSHSKLTWPHRDKVAEAEGILAIGGLLIAVFIDSKLALMIAVIIAAALGLISVEAIASILVDLVSQKNLLDA